MSRYNAQIYGFYPTHEKALDMLYEVMTDTDYRYEIKHYDDMSWYLWRMDQFDVSEIPVSTQTT